MSENTTGTTSAAPAAPAAHESATHAHIPSWAVLAIACAAQFMVVLDISIVNVALPKMGQSLHMNQSQLQWVVNAYALTFAGFLLLGGRAGDLFGRKKIFLLGLTVFVAASLVGGFAANGTMLEIARAAQGLGGAILAPSTLSLLTTTYTEQRERARALGLWSATAGSGGAFGVMAGGILTDELSWRWILFVNVPIGAVLFAAAWVSLKESRGQLRTISALDIPGTITVTGGLAVLVYAIVSTNQHAWGSSRTLLTIAIAVVLLGAFVAIERYTAQPLVPLRIFKLRALSSANGIAVAVGACMFSLFFFLSLYMQDVLHFSALKTGFAFVPGAVAIIIGAQTASRLVSKVGPRRIIASGAALAAHRNVVAVAPARHRQLLRARAAGDGVRQSWARAIDRAGDRRRDHGGRPEGSRPRIRPGQHHPSGRWRTGAGSAGHDRHRSLEGPSYPGPADLGI